MSRKNRILEVVEKNAVGRRMAADRRYRLMILATGGFACNLLYALYNGVLGLATQSFWLVTMGAYYVLLSIMRFSVILCERRRVRSKAADAGRMVMRLSGILLIFLSIVLSGSVYLSLARGTAARYHKIVMITLAVYTFCKLTLAIINAVKAKKNRSPLFAVMRHIGGADAAASMLSLQRSMLVSFGSADSAGNDALNAVSGAVVCLFVLGLGLRMTVTAGKIQTE